MCVVLESERTTRGCVNPIQVVKNDVDRPFGGPFLKSSCSSQWCDFSERQTKGIAYICASGKAANFAVPWVSCCHLKILPAILRKRKETALGMFPRVG